MTKKSSPINLTLFSNHSPIIVLSKNLILSLICLLSTVQHFKRCISVHTHTTCHCYYSLLICYSFFQTQHMMSQEMLLLEMGPIPSEQRDFLNFLLKLLKNISVTTIQNFKISKKSLFNRTFLSLRLIPTNPRTTTVSNQTGLILCPSLNIHFN